KCADNAELAREYVDWKNVPRLCRQAAEIDPQVGSPQWQDRAFTTVLPGKVTLPGSTVVKARSCHCGEPNCGSISAAWRQRRGTFFQSTYSRASSALSAHLCQSVAQPGVATRWTAGPEAGFWSQAASNRQRPRIARWCRKGCSCGAVS